MLKLKIFLYQMKKTTPQGPVNIGGIGDLPLLKTLLAIFEKL